METNIKTPADQAIAYAQRKAEEEQRIIRAGELKSLLRSLEGERREAANRRPEVDALIEQMKLDLEYQRNEFVRDLVVQASQKMTARIRFDSPSAIAYINYDRWIAAIPELAQKAAGNTPSLGRTISQINDEIMHIKIELGRMGVVA